MMKSTQEKAFAEAQAVRARHEDELRAKANVLGVGVGYRQRAGEATGEVVLVVMVTHKVPRAQLAPQDLIPSEIEGVPVDVQAIGEISAHGDGE